METKWALPEVSHSKETKSIVAASQKFKKKCVGGINMDTRLNCVIKRSKMVIKEVAEEKLLSWKKLFKS